MRTTRTALLVVAALFVVAGGYVHLQAWLDTYRHVPSAVDGSFVVRLGFPVNAAISLVLAAALVWVAVRRPRWTPAVVVAALGFEAASLGTLVLSRTGSVLGWSESVWDRPAQQARAAEIGALLLVGAAGSLLALRPRS